MRDDKKGLICFDLDNTLIHSNKAHIVAYKKALKKVGYSFITNQQLLSKFGLSSKVYLKELIPKITPKEIEEIQVLQLKYLEQTSKKYATRIRGVIGALRKIKKHYNVALVTTCSEEHIQLLMKSTQLDPKFFDTIVGNNHILKPKPAPDEIIKAEKLLKQKADYMVGDTVYDIIAARKAKEKSIGVTSGLQDYNKLKTENPHKILKSVKDLPKFLKL